MKLADFDTSVRYIAAVHQSHAITPIGVRPEVRELTLDIDKPNFCPAPGQSIGVVVPGDPAFGQAEHFRLYSVADLPDHTDDGRTRIRICVRRCDYVDPYNGESYKGRASNYLCDLRAGERVILSGPYGDVFPVPDDNHATLILIGAGTGIAPFRAFLRHIYQDFPDFAGKVWLFHGGRTGVDLLYRNEVRDDFSLYYDRETFEAIEALSNRPHWTDQVDWAAVIQPRADEIFRALAHPETHVYLAGLEPIRDELDREFARLFGDDEKWRRKKAELVAGGRWIELLY